MNNEERLIYFINEREAVRTRKVSGMPKPWTEDNILQSYRFCNISREDDKETIWIREHWRNPHCGDKYLVFAMALARLINWHPTLEQIGYPTKWRPIHFKDVCHSRQILGEKVFTGAYIVSTNGRSMDKVDYIANLVLTPLWESRQFIAPQAGDTLAIAHARLMQFDGLGSFMAAQVIADVKNTEGQVLHAAPDWWTWAASGPGSRRGLNRALGYDVTSPWREAHWLTNLRTLYDMVKSKLPNNLCMQDFQNCLCEFDKYERVRLGEGRPRSTYPGV